MKLFSKLAALTSCSVVGLSMLAPAMAQTANQPQQMATPQSDAKDGDRDTVVVTGSFSESLANAREIARASDNLVEVQSADDVGELPDQNIAEALRRLSSVYLIRDQGEGRYVSIRGVDPILNNVTMNGQTIAVSDTDGESGRAAPLDVLSSSALSRVEIHKVTLANMDGQGVGGSINIVTPSGFDHKNGYLNVNVEGGYNDFGKDSSIYAANVAWGDTFGANNEFALFLSSEYWFKQYTSQQYTSSGLWTNASLPAHTYFPGSVVYAESIGEKERYGVNANLEWKPTDNVKAWLRYYYTKYNDYRERPQITIATQGTRGYNNLNEFYAQRYAASMETRAEMQQRPVQQLVLGGERDFGGDWTIEGNLNYTTAKEENPYLRYFQSTGATTNAAAGQQPAITFTLNGRGLARPTAFNTALSDGLTFLDPAFERITAFRGVTSDVLEETWTGNVDLTHRGSFFGRELELSTGAKVILRDKSVNDTDYRYFPQPGQTYLLSSFPGLTSLFSDGRGEAYKPVPGFDLMSPDRRGYEAYFNQFPQNFYYDDASSRANSMENDYTLNEDIYAAYLMGNYHITDKLSVIAGVRVEQTNSDIAAMGFVNEVTADPDTPAGRSRVGEVPFKTSDIIDISRSHDYTNVLPSIALKWDVSPNWLFRASATTNIGRPDYTDIAPISSISVTENYDPINDHVDLDGSVEIGNPDLAPYKSMAFDASLDYYFTDKSGAITLGAFYKRIDNAIYDISNEYENYKFEGVTYDHYFEETVANANAGYVQGVEFGVQKDFTFLPGALSGLGFYGNATFIDSQVEIDVGGLVRKVPFFNQADKIFNAQLYYDYHGLSARIAYSFQGDATSSSFSTNPDMDNFRSPRETWDARISYKFDNGLQFWLTGSNLSNPANLNYRNGNERYISSYEIFGREFRLGVSKTW